MSFNYAHINADICYIFLISLIALEMPSFELILYYYSASKLKGNGHHFTKYPTSLTCGAEAGQALAGRL